MEYLWVEVVEVVGDGTYGSAEPCGHRCSTPETILLQLIRIVVIPRPPKFAQNTETLSEGMGGIYDLYYTGFDPSHRNILMFSRCTCGKYSNLEESEAPNMKDTDATSNSYLLQRGPGW
jgi:hypothetical protein